MTTFKRTTYVGDRPVCTNQPISFPGGFTLDTEATGFMPSTVIPAGTLAAYNELTRKVKILKTAKVKEVSDDRTFISLETNAYLEPLFAVGDTITNGSHKSTITQIRATKDNYSITVDGEFPELKEGDILWQTFNDHPDMVPTALVITDTTVSDPTDHTGIDISIDSGAGLWYIKRIPPIPSHMIENNLLKANPNIKFTQSS